MSPPNYRPAVIDVGSSAIKYAIYRFEGRRPSLVHEADPIQTGLGRGLVAGRPLPPRARELTLEVIRRYLSEIRAAPAELALIVATEAVRIAADRRSFLTEIKTIAGPDVNVVCITARDEARWAYLSAQTTLAPLSGPVICIDPGGSSNDLAFGRDREPSRYSSLRFGMNRLIELVDPNEDAGRVSAVGRRTILDFLNEQYAVVADAWRDVAHECRLIATSGAVIAAGAVKLGMKERDRKSRVLATHGLEMCRDDFVELAERMSPVSTSDRQVTYPCLQPSRAAIFVHGCLIFVALLDALRIPKLTINGFGMKLGGIVSGHSQTPESSA